MTFANSMNPGCNCCTTCTIGADGFDSDADPPGGWTQEVGTDWETTSGTLRTSTSNASLTYDTPHPRSVASAYVTCKLFGATGDSLRIQVNKTDDSNYHFVEVIIGDPNGCLALWRRVGGSNTLISKMRVAAAASTLHTVTVYFGADLFAAVFGTGTTDPTLYHAELGYTGAYVGLGTGTVSSTVRFDDFEFRRHHTDESDETTCPVFVPKCELLADPFTRTDDGDIGCTYDEAIGAWAISSNKLVTLSANAQAVVQAKHPFDRASVRITATIRTTAAADQLRIIFGRTDASNYFCGEWTFAGASPRTKLRQCVAGTFTDLISFANTGLTVNTSVGVDICFGGGRVTIDGESMDLTTPTSGPFDVALGTGTLTGTASFDDFTLGLEGRYDEQDYDSDEILELHCPVCPVECCCGNDAGTEWIVDFGTGGWTDGRCNQCNEVQGEFSVTRNTSITGHELTCLYTYIVNDWCDDSLDCDYGAHDGLVALVIALRIPLFSPFVPTCTITCRVEIAQDLGEDGFCTALCYTNYSGTFTKADFENCNDPEFIPFTLTRESDACTANNNLGRLCGGRMPSSITIRTA